MEVFMGGWIKSDSDIVLGLMQNKNIWSFWEKKSVFNFSETGLISGLIK